MSFNPKITAEYFLELASEQRLGILLQLNEKNLTLTELAKKLDATAPEVSRNLQRLKKNELIKKESDGSYHLSTSGKAILSQIPSLVFLKNNKNHFKDHDFGDVPIKFIMRLGQLFSGQTINGFVKVQEKWQQIYKNADKYIYNILSEVLYSEELMSNLISKLKDGIKINSIFSETAVIPEKRKEILKKFNFKKFSDESTFGKKMKKEVKISIVLSEKEAGIMFSKDDEADISTMFYHDNKEFHSWCFDYFKYCWENASQFQERKLNDQSR